MLQRGLRLGLERFRHLLLSFGESVSVERVPDVITLSCRRSRRWVTAASKAEPDSNTAKVQLNIESGMKISLTMILS